MSLGLQPPSKTPDNPLIRPDRVRVVTVAFRKQGMSEEDFHSYWRDEHSQIFASIAIVKRNLIKYEQSHCSKEALESMKKGGFPAADFDGLAILEAESFEKIREVFADEEYKNVVGADEDKFMDRKKSLVFPADIVSIFNDPT
ncbi:MAG: hypothetical protein Q9163_006431 [Psora crenata]